MSKPRVHIGRWDARVLDMLLYMFQVCPRFHLPTKLQLGVTMTATKPGCRRVAPMVPVVGLDVFALFRRQQTHAGEGAGRRIISTAVFPVNVGNLNTQVHWPYIWRCEALKLTAPLQEYTWRQAKHKRRSSAMSRSVTVDVGPFPRHDKTASTAERCEAENG
jgi:hypothetical protein